jgi:hypothetical protein
MLQDQGATPEEVKQMQKDKKLFVRVGHLGRKLRSNDELYILEEDDVENT